MGCGEDHRGGMERHVMSRAGGMRATEEVVVRFVGAAL